MKIKSNIWVQVVAVIIIIVVAFFVFLKPKPSPAIVKNEIILQKGPGKYMEVRHIVLKGSNEEIGRALGDIARQEYRTRLVKYASPVYAKARLEYMKKNYPVMLERMKGVARSYGLSLDKTDYDTSSLFYWRTPAPKCSALYIPAGIAENGHNFYACNRDYYTASMSEIMGGKRKLGEEDFSARVFVIELYPDKGYPSIGMGILDLLSTNIDAINSSGLSVAVLADDTYGIEHATQDLSRQSGLYIYQAVRLIVDTCATLEEAKEALLNNKISMSLLPAHFIVMDGSGRSFIYERTSRDFSGRFIDSKGKAVPITNHSIYDYPTVDKFAEPVKDDYDTFNRYRRLDNYIKEHKGKYSFEDGKQAMSLLYGRVEEASEGGHHDLPLRTLYTAIVDMDERTMWVRFYQRDGEKDLKTGLPELIFSEPFKFKLK